MSGFRGSDTVKRSVGEGGDFLRFLAAAVAVVVVVVVAGRCCAKRRSWEFWFSSPATNSLSQSVSDRPSEEELCSKQTHKLFLA